MSGLLKAGDTGAQAAVHTFAAAIAPDAAACLPGSALPARASAEELHLAALEREIAALNADLHSAALSAETRAKDAYARGQKAGLAEAESREKERLLALAQAVDTAHHAHTAALEQLEVLALSVAQAALGRIFGDHSRYADMVADALRHQLALVDRSLVTQFRIAPADFAGKAALDALAAEHPDIPVLTDPALGSGDCMIDLQLGRIEAGPGKQWQELSGLLTELAQIGAEVGAEAKA